MTDHENEETSEMTPAQERRAAEARVKQAQKDLENAAQEAADAQQGMVAVVSRDIPKLVVVVNENCEVCDEQDPPVSYSGGDEVTLDGPTALSLVQLGYVTLKGVAS